MKITIEQISKEQNEEVILRCQEANKFNLLIAMLC